MEGGKTSERREGRNERRRQGDGQTMGERTDERPTLIPLKETNRSLGRNRKEIFQSDQGTNPQAEHCVSRLHSEGCHFAPQCISNSAVLRCRSTVISIRFVLKFIGRSKSSIQYSISRLHVHASQQKPIHRSLPSPKNYRRRSRAREAIAAVATASCVQ